MPIILIALSLALVSGWSSHASRASVSHVSDAHDHSEVSTPHSDIAAPFALAGSAAVCETLKHYPLPEGSKLAYEMGEIAPICKPFVSLSRKQLDRCGDTSRDPYSGPSTHSSFTWASRNDMANRGKVNLLTEPEFAPQVNSFFKHAADLKESAAALCCGSDHECRQEFARVDVTLCRPQTDPSAPDPCVFGGSFKMPGDGYSAIFRSIFHLYGSAEAQEFRRLAEHNLAPSELASAADPSVSWPIAIPNGDIVLSSYVPRARGTAAMEPVLLHEFGHACSMVKMQQWALSGVSGGVFGGASSVRDEKRATEKADLARAMRAARWLDSARNRCQVDQQLPEGYYDFWESIGESRALAACLYKLTTANQKQQVDHPCPALCPGHYLEESVGIAFSLLLGDLRGTMSSVFPNTCDHVRDGQHPMVSDVADCLMQNSPRFRDRLAHAYGCEASARLSQVTVKR